MNRARQCSLTQHAQARMQQRTVPPLVLDWLETYGRETHAGGCSVILSFDKPARRRLERAIGREPVRRMKQWLNAYAVMGENGTLLTVGYRYRRLPHH